MDQNTNKEFNPTSHQKKWKLIGIIALVIAIGAFAVIYTQISTANADYICTYIVEENDPCGNGSWGAWTTISTSGDSEQCTQVTTEKRTYTGTRETRHILEYLNLRTACESGYKRKRSGSRGGSSGFHGGRIVSETAACQIEEIRVTEGVVAGDDSASCDTNTTTTDTQTDLGTDTQSTNISAKDQLTKFRKSKIGGWITVDPKLLPRGTSTTVQWQGVEMTSCTVTGSNGDRWKGTAGQKLSSPIEFATTFTFDCTAFNGTKFQDFIKVNILPDFREI